MEGAEKDVIKGMLLDKWINDLKHDRAPRWSPELRELSSSEIEEVMELARWFKGTLCPGQVTEGEISAVHNTVMQKVAQERAAEQDSANRLLAAADSFGALLGQAMEQRGIDTSDLERALSMPDGVIRRLQSGDLPPHRLPQGKMVAVLRGLRLTSSRIVDLIRQACVEWAKAAYSAPQTQLGRLDAKLTADDRHRLLNTTDSNRDDEGLATEMKSIDDYCRAISSMLR